MQHYSNPTNGALKGRFVDDRMKMYRLMPRQNFTSLHTCLSSFLHLLVSGITPSSEEGSHVLGSLEQAGENLPIIGAQDRCLRLEVRKRLIPEDVLVLRPPSSYPCILRQSMHALTLACVCYAIQIHQPVEIVRFDALCLSCLHSCDFGRAPAKLLGGLCSSEACSFSRTSEL